jgi:glucose-6-phosphate isomerase
MSITAARLGSAPVTVDWSSLMSAGIPAGATDVGPVAPAWETLSKRFTSGEIGFYDTPVNDALSQLTATRTLADSILRANLFTDCLALGIGGSSLGPISLLGALSTRCLSGIRFHFLENPDPLEWREMTEKLDPARTLVLVITKSGTTFETLAQMLLALEWLGKSRWKTHVVAVTDPQKGDLKAFATQQGIPTLDIAPSIGGRFSIFTPVGLFPAAIAGLKIGEFMAGAKMIRDYVEKAPPEKNPLFILGNELIRHSRQRGVHVCMPYSTKLKQLGAWFVQLWGESLGKDGKGFTPIAAVGATDQHSILQLLRDGPDDKVTLFVTVDHIDDEVVVPKITAAIAPSRDALASFKMLEGHTLHQLLKVEYRATALVLTKRGRPNLTFQLDDLSEKSMGALYFAVSMLTAFTGTQMGINPFDQPGVEEGKVYIRESLGQEREIAYQRSAAESDNSPVGRLRRDHE